MAKAKQLAKKAKGKPGRPRIEFDLAAVEGLGRIGATAVEMAAVLPASQSTIEHRLADKECDFSKAYQKGFSLLKTSLRRKQVQVAMSGNTTMLIWLGKQILKQSDKHEVRSPDEIDPDVVRAEAEILTVEEARAVLDSLRY